MDTNQLCINCLSEKGTTGVCPACGFDEGEQEVSPLFLPPRTILEDRYLLGRVLGHGGFGITYLALDLRLGNKLAIKEYFPQNLATRASGQTKLTVFTGESKDNFTYGLNQFLDEAKMLAKFNDHPSIISVYDFFQENGTGYMVMEYLDGINFKEYLDQKGGKVSFETAIEIMNPVMDALREVHATGLMHRDISPDNIYITAKKQVKLLDFGAARYATGEQSKSLSVILKPGYAPWEQYYSKGNQGAWTDVYAVAATIYRALTGETPPESLDRMEQDEMQLPSKLGIQIPDNAEKVLTHALAVRADERFQSIHELQDAFNMEKVFDPKEKKLQSSQLPVPPIAEPERRKEKDPVTQNYKPIQRNLGRKLSYAGLAVVLSLIAVFFIYWGISHHPADGTSKVMVTTSPEANDIQTMPDVVGKTFAEAQKTIESQRLVVKKVATNTNAAGQDIVITQSVAPRTKVKAGTEVILEVSKGSQANQVPQTTKSPEKAVADLVVVPSVTGATYQSALKMLTNQSLKVKRVDTNRDTAKDTVIAQDPLPNTKVKKNSLITLTVSSGSQTKAVVATPLRVRIWTDKPQYQEGDKVKIYISGNKPFYARVVYLDASGNIIQIMPNPYRENNYFSGGITYELPSAGDRYEMEVTAPFGTESAIIYASTTQLGPIDITKSDAGVYIVHNNLNDVNRKSRGIILKPKSGGTQAADQEAEFAEARVSLRTMK